VPQANFRWFGTEVELREGMFQRIILGAVALTSVFAFQNCNNVKFQEASLGKLGVCDGVSCELTPLTRKPAVTTILLAIGDEADDQLVVNGASSQLIAETVVRYSTNVENPRILLVQDTGADREDPEDTVYVKKLLSRYDVDFMIEPEGGITDEHVKGYDLVWFNNPGKPMGSETAKDVLMRFKGGVVLQGDDLTRGPNMNLEALTGLKYIDNGEDVTCNGKDYHIDNNTGNQYRVSLDPTKIPGADASTINFKYGNDIDTTRIVREGLEVLAYAVGDIAGCTSQRPAIVRYVK
jgi:hypothetical protein